jgi:hypothetical protein
LGDLEKINPQSKRASSIVKRMLAHSGTTFNADYELIAVTRKKNGGSQLI